MYFVYIISNFNRTVLYIGVTGNHNNRIYAHKHAIEKSFSCKYNLKYLVYFEEYQYILDAIAREKQIKNWHREWKWNLIKKTNPELKDLMQEE